jgi:hypothetical protein
MDEVYRMHESVLLHYSTGIRFVMVTSENYNGDEVTYKLGSPFINTLDGTKYFIEDIDLENQLFIAPPKSIGCDG